MRPRPLARALGFSVIKAKGSAQLSTDGYDPTFSENQRLHARYSQVNHNLEFVMSTIKVFSFSLLLVCIQLPAQAATIYSSNFNSATTGQAISAPPLNWSADAGVVRVGTTQHPGWSGNAVVGSLSTSAGYGYAQASIDLPAMPTTGTIALTFDGWAYSQYYTGGYITLNTASGSALEIGAWVNCCGLNGWYTHGYTPFTNSFQNYSSNSMQDVTVHASLLVDYTNNTYWGTFNNGVNSILSPIFTFVGTPQFTSLSVYEDQRWGSHGFDVANIQVSSSTPIPAAAFFVAPALAGVFGFSRRKRAEGYSTKG